MSSVYYLPLSADVHDGVDDTTLCKDPIIYFCLVMRPPFF